MKKWIAAVLAFFMLPIAAIADEAPDMHAIFEAKAPMSYYVDVPGRSKPVLYYAQNDDVWGEIPYRRRKPRAGNYTIGGAGCEPTAMAIVFRYLLTDEQLWEMVDMTYKKKGFSFCTCSTSWFGCDQTHEQFLISNVEEMTRYLPIVMASYAGGNNKLGRGGYNTSNMIMSHFNIRFKRGTSSITAVSEVEKGAIAMLSVGTKNSPFTINGHYLTLMGTDEEYLYFLDPNLQDYAKTDKKKLLEIISPGFVRAKREDLRNLGITGFLLLYPEDESKEG